jgi:hypothetical protein
MPLARGSYSMEDPEDEEVIDIWEDFTDRVGHPDPDPSDETDETDEDFWRRLRIAVSRRVRLWF